MTKVIYHKSDFDGIFCREIAKKFLPDAELIGWEYGEPTPEVGPEDNLYILDLSVPDLMNHPRLIWIDHHKSAIEKYDHTIKGYRIDGVAACRLTWQYFIQQKYGYSLPTKEAYRDRLVEEPLAVRLAGEYDIWDRRDPNAELFQHGLRSMDLDWSQLLSDDERVVNFYVSVLLENGRALQYAKTKENASIIKSSGFKVYFEGLVFLACNHARFNSFLFAAKDSDEYDAFLGFNWTGTQWRVSMYHKPGREAEDLSLIAVKYGGGGHKGACGFTCDELPFKLKP